MTKKWASLNDKSSQSLLIVKHARFRRQRNPEKIMKEEEEKFFCGLRSLHKRFTIEEGRTGSECPFSDSAFQPGFREA